MEPWSSNRRKLLELLEEKKAKTLILTNQSNIIYATGMRDPTGYLILSSDCGNALITPLLDYHRVLAQTPRDIEVYAFHRGGEQGLESDIPKKRLLEGKLSDVFSKYLEGCKGKVITDAGSATFQIAKLLHEKFDAEDVSSDIARIRSIKSDDELELINKAVEIAEKAYAYALNLLAEGITEAEIASIIYKEIVTRNGWGVAFPTIVAFYSNTAYPHHSPGQDRLTVEGPVLIDWGAVYQGYRSDCTRTFWWGTRAPTQFQRHLEAVLDAVNAAYDILGPGVDAGDVDNAARIALRRNGLSKYFIHGLGHGVGIDIHEEPYLRPASKTILEPRMVVTIEPGIYLPGLYGIRIENLVVITKIGFKSLTTLPHIIPP